MKRYYVNGYVLPELPVLQLRFQSNNDINAYSNKNSSYIPILKVKYTNNETSITTEVSAHPCNTAPDAYEVFVSMLRIVEDTTDTLVDLEWAFKEALYGVE